MLYKNMEAMVHSPDGNINFIDIVWGLLQSDESAIHVYSLTELHNSKVDKSNKRKWFYSKKNKKKQARSGRYSAETITDADYSNDIKLLTNTTEQAKSQLHWLE